MKLLEGEKGLSIILGDADRVHSYVFETSKLPEIRGGSELLNDLNYEELERIFKELNCLAEECLIYNGGGSFLARVPANLSDSIIEKIGKEYFDKTGIATITCVKKDDYLQFSQGEAPYTHEDIKNLKAEGIGKWLIESHFKDQNLEWKGFGEIVAHLSVELRWKKDMKKNIPFFEALPIGRRCNSCGKRVAVHDDMNKEIWLCNVCRIKRDRSGEAKLHFWMKFNDFLLRSENVHIENYYSKLPSDLEDITNYDNYYAFIYADGNDIGSLLEEIKTPEQYKHFAKGLKEAVHKSVYGALLDTFGEAKLNEMEIFPFEIINIGGDDVTIIIAKPFAFKFSALLLKKFEENTKALAKEFRKENITIEKENLTIEKENLTMSSGMTICKSKYPVYFAQKIAETLLREAKKRAKEKEESALNYIYLTTHIASESGKDLLDMLYSVEKGFERLYLTMRPYTLDEFIFLLKKAQELREEELLSRTQRNAFQQALAKSRWVALNFISYQIARMRDDKRNKIKEILKELSLRFECDRSLFWKLQTNNWIEYSTPLFDLLELVEIGGEVIETKS